MLRGGVSHEEETHKFKGEVDSLRNRLDESSREMTKINDFRAQLVMTVDEQKRTIQQLQLEREATQRECKKEVHFDGQTDRRRMMLSLLMLALRRHSVRTDVSIKNVIPENIL